MCHQSLRSMSTVSGLHDGVTHTWTWHDDIHIDEVEMNYSEKGGNGTACLISSEQPAGTAGNMTGSHFIIRRM